ncbi:MAG: KH domain-containing protein [Patescibacteria group bacterium]|nr:KH domain-containing protein [Patescibacteria group bacterium]
MKELLSYILTNILENEKDVEVSEEENDGFVVLKVSVPKEEIGKVIGKGGKTINSIKNILKIKAIKEGKRIDIEVVEKS